MLGEIFFCNKPTRALCSLISGRIGTFNFGFGRRKETEELKGNKVRESNRSHSHRRLVLL